MSAGDIYLRETRGGHAWSNPLYAATYYLTWLFDVPVGSAEAAGLGEILDQKWQCLCPADRERLHRLAAILAEVDGQEE